MSERDPPDLYAESVVRAHLRRIAIDEILRSLAPDAAEQAVSLAVQRLVQYLDEGPVPSIGLLASHDQLQTTVDAVIEELRQSLASTHLR